MNISIITQERLLKAKLAFTPRHLQLESVTTLLDGKNIIPNTGDMVLVKVLKIGQYKALELANGDKSLLHAGDELIVCYGNLHIINQIEAQIPADLAPCHLVAASGVAAYVNYHHIDADASTVIEPIGLLADSNKRRINLKDFALPKLMSLFPHPYTIGVIGNPKNAAQATTTEALIRGLTYAGYIVGTAKLTGVISRRDTWLMVNAGSKLTLDFTHAGFSSTYRISSDQIDNIIGTLITHLSVARLDTIVIEIAQDLSQPEAVALVSSRVLAKTVDSMILTASDAIDALFGAELLKRKKLPLAAICGQLTASSSVAAKIIHATGLPILDQKALRSKAIVDILQIPLPLQTIPKLTHPENKLTCNANLKKSNLYNNLYCVNSFSGLHF